MLQYLIAGLVIGGVYAIASAGLVITYISSGILNFAYGAIAFFIARTFYFLNIQHGWSIAPAAVLSIGVIAPVLGAGLWAVLLRFLSDASTLTKIVATIGLSVTIPAVTTLLYGNPDIVSAPGLAPQPVASYNVFGVAITLDQVIVAACAVAIISFGTLVLRFTEWGLMVRAIVDSPALTSLSGTNSSIVSVCVWSLTTLLAGLAGVLVAPLIGLTSGNYTLLMAAAFTAVLIARFNRLGRAVVVSLGLGVTSAVVQYFMPPTSTFTGGMIASIPFAFMLAYLLWRARSGVVIEDESMGGALDRAIRPASGQQSAAGTAQTIQESRLDLHASRRRIVNQRTAAAIGSVLVVLALSNLLQTYWVGLIGEGMCFAIIFLSFTLVTGEGGMIWLCQAAFAGIGAVMTAHLATVDHWPVLLAIVASAAIAIPGGALIGVLTTRLGDLYVALATLTFGLLMDNLVLSLPIFNQSGNGVAVARPSFASSPRVFDIVVLAAFCIIAIMVENIRRSTMGLAIVAVRWSEQGARTTGLSVVQAKVLLATVAAFIASLGGGFLATYFLQAVPQTFGTLDGILWLAVLVTIGVRSSIAACVAGIIFVVLPALFQTYLPLSVVQVPTLLFGLGAIMLSRNPDGAVAMYVRQGRALVPRILERTGR